MTFDTSTIVTPMVMMRLDTMQDVLGWLEWAAERIAAVEGAPVLDASESRAAIMAMTENLAELIRQAGHAINSSPLVFFRTVDLKAGTSIPMPPRLPDETGH